MAEVLAWVFQLRSWSMGEGIEPQKPSRLMVPPELDPEGKHKVATNA